MATVYYTYEKSLFIEDEVDVPQHVIDRGEKAIRIYVKECVWAEEYDPACASEEESVTVKVAEEEA